MTPAAKPPLSLQQVPPAPLESEKPGSFNIPTIQQQHRAIKTANEEDEGGEEGEKDIKKKSGKGS